MLNFTIKWVQLIVESSFPVILAQKNLLSYPEVGVGEPVKVRGRGGVVATLRYLFLLLIQKYWCFILETSCVRYLISQKPHQNRIFLGFLAKIWNLAYFHPKSVKSSFRDSDVIKTYQCDVKWRATGTLLVSIEREDSYLSSSTKIIRIGGLIAKI